MYMAVTADQLELPLCVEDTAEKLGKRYGVTRDDVYSSISKGLSGKKKGFKFVKVCEGKE